MADKVSPSVIIDRWYKEFFDTPVIAKDLDVYTHCGRAVQTLKARLDQNRISDLPKVSSEAKIQKDQNLNKGGN